MVRKYYASKGLASLIIQQESMFFKSYFLTEKNLLCLLQWPPPSRSVIQGAKKIILFYTCENFHPASHILKISFSPLHFYRITVFLLPYLPLGFPPHCVRRCSVS
jgi:hypothetical protein